MTEAASAQVSAAIRAALEPAGQYAALVTRNNPLGAASALTGRQDVRAALEGSMGQARAAAVAVLEQQWADSGAPEDPVLASLRTDLARMLGSPGQQARLRRRVRAAHASVPQQQFTPGVTPPGTHPSHEAAQQRAQAVSAAVGRFAGDVALRAQLTLAVAATAAAARLVLEEGRARQAAGEKLAKRWEISRSQPEKACHWCRSLDGVTIGLEDSFLPYLAGPADLSGHGRLTQPPKPYRGLLQGPPLHPRCRCRIVLVEQASEPPEKPEPKHDDDQIARPAETQQKTRSQASTRPAPRFVSAAEIRAMPEARYQGLLAFLRAALHELGQMLGRLRGAVRSVRRST